METKRILMLAAGILIIIVGIIMIIIAVNDKPDEPAEPDDGGNVNVTGNDYPTGMVDPEVYEDMLNVRYWHGGSMLGDSYAVTADEKEGTITIESRESAGEPTVTSVYEADYDVFKELDEIFTKYGMYEWGELPPSEIFAFDAAWTTLSVYKGHKSMISVSTNDMLPDDGYDALREIKECMERNCTRKVSETSEK